MAKYHRASIDLVTLTVPWPYFFQSHKHDLPIGTTSRISVVSSITPSSEARLELGVFNGRPLWITPWVALLMRTVFGQVYYILLLTYAVHKLGS
jgi:hypothetical protein